MAVRPVFHAIGLCAGVGGLELGIRLGEHLRGRDVRGVCYVEREAAAAASLVASMDAGWLHPAPVWSDLATFDGDPWRGRVHLVASGDPCQGNSVAGKRLGADDPRFLIRDVLRTVDAVRPHRFVRENVPGNAAGQLAALVGPLEDMGYRVAAGIFSSAETGNSHGRQRLVVVADADGGRGAPWPDVSGLSPIAGPDGVIAGSDVDLDDAGPWRCDQGALRSDTRAARSRRGHAATAGFELANTNGFRRRPEGVASNPPDDAYQSSPQLANASSSRLAGQSGHRQVGEYRAAARRGSVDVPPAVVPGPDDPVWADLLAAHPHLAPALTRAEAQSLFRGGLDALAYRIERLRAGGNGVDPVVGAYAYLRLCALLDDDRRRAAWRPGQPVLMAA